MFLHSCLNFLQSSFPTYLHVKSICWNVVFSLNCFWNLEFAQGNNFLPNIRQIMIPLVMFRITYIICVYASDRSWKMTVLLLLDSVHVFGIYNGQSIWINNGWGLLAVTTERGPFHALLALWWVLSSRTNNGPTRASLSTVKELFNIIVY